MGFVGGVVVGGAFELGAGAAGTGVLGAFVCAGAVVLVGGVGRGGGIAGVRWAAIQLAQVTTAISRISRFLIGNSLLGLHHSAARKL